MDSTGTSRPPRLGPILALLLLGASCARPATAAPSATPPARPLLRPTPIVSLGGWTTGSMPDTGRLVDGRFRGAAWGGGTPTPERPTWAAIRLQRDYRRLLVTWSSSHNHDYF